MKNITSRPSYKERVSHIEEQISHWKEEVRKAEKSYFKAKEKESARRNTYKEDGENDWESRKPLVKKLHKTMDAFHEAESKLEERTDKQEKLLAEDKDYYGERAVHIQGKLASRNEKLIQVREERYEKALKRNQKSESNRKLTEKARQEFQYIKDKVEGWNKQKEVFLGKGSEQYNYEKRYSLGEKTYQETVERITDEIINDLDGKGKRNRFPSSRGGMGGHKELPITELMPQEEVDDDEERVNKNDPRNKVKSELRTRKRIEKNTENNQYNSPKSFTQEGFTKEIDKVLKAEVPQKGRLYEGEVVKIDQHGNAVLSFYGGDMDGLMYNRGNTGLKVGDKKLFKFEERSKRRGRYIFTFPPKKKKSESAVTEEVENALV